MIKVMTIVIIGFLTIKKILTNLITIKIKKSQPI